MNFEDYIERRRELVNVYLEKRLSLKGIGKVDDAMHYSLFAGGKRWRPLLLMAAADAVGGEGYHYLPVAAGLELIHTYSLIHDDLPAMDNDDYRRGHLSNHKVFGDALAILAGDGLLTLAFEIMPEQKNVSPAVLLEVIREIAMCAGNFGMVGGQSLDIETVGIELTPEMLNKIATAKTGALIIAAVRAGVKLAGGTDEQLLALTRFAELFGLAYQITDDIMDVESTLAEMGKAAARDEDAAKSTYVSVCTLEGAKLLAEKTVAEALVCLEQFGEKAEPLVALTKHVCIRHK